jgi:hypothetical protein
MFIALMPHGITYLILHYSFFNDSRFSILIISNFIALNEYLFYDHFINDFIIFIQIHDYYQKFNDASLIISMLFLQNPFDSLSLLMKRALLNLEMITFSNHQFILQILVAKILDLESYHHCFNFFIFIQE